MSSKINASQTVMAMDCIGTAAGKPKSQRIGYYQDGTKDVSAVGNKRWAVDPPRLTATSDYADTQRRASANRSGPDPRHQRKANVAFCDGHVDLMTPGELGYVVDANGAMGVTGQNKLFSGTGCDDDPPAAD